MNEEILQQLLDKSSIFIDKLSQALGVTGEYAFQAMVKLQPAQGIASLVAVMLWMVSTLCFEVYMAKRVAKTEAYSDERFGLGMAMVFLPILFAVPLAFMAAALVQILAPEASAINSIINSIK